MGGREGGWREGWLVCRRVGVWVGGREGWCVGGLVCGWEGGWVGVWVGGRCVALCLPAEH